MEIYEIKRREFEVLETIGENSKKLTRKNKIYFLKHYADAKEMDKALTINKKFSSSGIQVPDVRYINKKTNDVLYDYIDGKCPLEDLQFGDLSEEVYEELFKMYWRCKQEKITLNFNPLNFCFSNGKLYYFSTEYNKFESQEVFLNKDVRMWFYSKELVSILKQNGLKTEGTLEEEYATNKRITLMCVKHYR